MSYTKGCYTGQETVARLHFRGHTNRELRGLRWSEAEPLDGRAVVHGEKDVGSVRSTLTLEDRMLGLGLLRREVGPGETVAAGGRRAKRGGAAVRGGRGGWVTERQRAPGRCPGPGATVGPAAYFFVVSRAIVESDDIALSCDIPPVPCRCVGVAAGAIAAVSAAGMSAFFSPQPTSTSTAASIMVFFIVAPDTLGLWH